MKPIWLQEQVGQSFLSSITAGKHIPSDVGIVADGYVGALLYYSHVTTACILVRKGFAEENPQAVEKFLADFAESAAWVNENVDDAAAACGQYEIVKEPIAKKAIPQCNIVCITGAEMKEKLSGYLEVLYDQDPASVGGALPEDDFYYGA